MAHHQRRRTECVHEIRFLSVLFSGILCWWTDIFYCFFFFLFHLINWRLTATTASNWSRVQYAHGCCFFFAYRNAGIRRKKKKRNSDNHMKKWISRSARIRLWVKRIFIARTLNKPKMHFNSVFGKQYSCVISFTIQRCSVIFHF